MKTPFRLVIDVSWSVVVVMVERLVPDEVWKLILPPPVRSKGGGRRRHGDREVLAAIIFAATWG